ncbi:MAG: nucleotidyl transferase AbiEii/AbiGii toxin family protein [Myxococcales bacterium]|nr:nucleotidyl transferase AbiEii/AbiGii toxin family protein [Myxococcales bacterium]
MSTRTYSSPEAFRKALEDRLRKLAPGPRLNRQRQLLVFDRLLARIDQVLGEAATLKGGLVLELRLDRARTTKDVDLRMMGTPQNLLARLQEAGRTQLGDFMFFELAPDAEDPESQNDGMPYDGYRFRAECTIGGKLFGQRFGVDVAFGDPMVGAAERVTGEDLLDFIGVPPPSVRLYPVETHLAEKLHAYTMPRQFPNTRVKDLPDLALLATTKRLEARTLREAIATTFAHRNTHTIPTALQDPPDLWVPVYEALAREDELAWKTIAEVVAAARAFLNPILGSDVDAVWEPTSWAWRSR